MFSSLKKLIRKEEADRNRNECGPHSQRSNFTFCRPISCWTRTLTAKTWSASPIWRDCPREWRKFGSRTWERDTRNIWARRPVRRRIATATTTISTTPITTTTTTTTGLRSAKADGVIIQVRINNTQNLFPSLCGSPGQGIAVVLVYRIIPVDVIEPADSAVM